MDDENYFLDLKITKLMKIISPYQPVIAVTAVVLICLNVQMALFGAVGISYTGKNYMMFSFSSYYVEENPHGPPFSFSNIPCSCELLFPHPIAVMVLHAAFRKLTSTKQSARRR